MDDAPDCERVAAMDDAPDRERVEADSDRERVETDDERLLALTPLAIALTCRDEFVVVANRLERLEARIASLEETLVAIRAAISTVLVGPPPP